MPFAAVCSYITVALIFILPRYENQIWDWRDYAALGLFIPLLAWLLSDRRSRLEGSDAHQDPSNLISFRMGQALNRVGRRLRGRA